MECEKEHVDHAHRNVLALQSGLVARVLELTALQLLQALQFEADDAEQEAQQALQMAEEQLMELACTVQRFQEQIAQVLPDVSRKRAHDHM